MFTFTYVAAPVLWFLYGIVRLIDGIDGVYGPGPAWTVGHLLFLAALILFIPLLFGLARGVRWGPVAAAVGTVGLLIFIRVVVIDLIAGFQAVDRPELSRISKSYRDWPVDIGGGFYDWGQALFPAVLAGLLIGLAVARRLPWWSPVAATAGLAALSISLNLLAVGAAAVFVALLPLVRRGGRRSSITGGETVASAGGHRGDLR